jgi:hypothetical protein
MGQFDDLVPAGGGGVATLEPKQGQGGAFDDLVPKTSQNAFDDLVPKTPEQAIPYALAVPQQANQLMMKQLALGSEVAAAPYKQQLIQTTFGRIPVMPGGEVPQQEIPLSQTLQELAQKVPTGQSLPTQLLYAGARTGLDLAGGLVEPGNLAAVAGTMVAPPLAAATLPYFAYQTGKGAYEQGKEVARLYQAPGPVDAEFKQKLANALIGTGASAAMAGELGYQGIKAGAGLVKGGLPVANTLKGESAELGQPAPAVSSDEIMQALRRNQIVRQELQPESSTLQVTPEVQGPPVVEAAPSATMPAPVVQPAVPSPSLPHPEMDFNRPGVAPLEMAPIGSVQAPAVQAAPVPEVNPKIEVQQQQARAVRAMEQQRENLPTPPKAPPGSNPLGLRPAIVLMGGHVVPGQLGQTHDEIIADNKLSANDIDQRIFVDAKGNKFTREQAAQLTPQIPTTYEQGRRHANELPEATQQQTQQEVTPNDTQSQRGIQGSVPPNRQELRDVQKQGGGPEAVGANKEVQEEVGQTPLRQEVEKQSDFLHDLNGLAGLIKGNADAKRITKEQGVKFKVRATKVNDELQAGRIDQAEAKRRLGIIREDIANQVTLGEELGPQEVPKAQAEELVGKLKMTVNRKGELQTVQALNTLRNRLHPSEWQMYKDAGIETAFGSSVKPEDLKGWLRENSPRVEVKTKGGIVQNEKLRLLNEKQHELETKGYRVVRNNVDEEDSYVQKDGKTIQEGDDPIADEFYNLTVGVGAVRDVGQTNWQSIAPKTESEMPGYVEGAVTLPLKMSRDEARVKASGQPITDDWSRQVARTQGELFPSSHSFPPNTLGFFRGYMETRPDGGKTFHVVEVQSDWASQAREALESAEGLQRSGVNNAREYAQSLQHPLLKDWERLTLKAAIEHARKEGADRIAVSDAETAMMTEGHDRAMSETRAFGTTAEEAIRTLREGGWDVGRNPIATRIGHNEWIIRGKIHQEPGMRLHYDQILPKLLGELTGEKGKKVEFGEHKMALDTSKVDSRIETNLDVNPPTYKVINTRTGEVKEFKTHDEAWNYADNLRPPRKDLIFRTPTGEPKTSVSATEFPIGGAREQFSLFGSDRAIKPQESPSSPGDYDRYTELTSKMREALGRKDFQAFYEMQKETEAIKNRNKGMPPTEPIAPQEAASRSVHKVDTTSLSPYQQSTVEEFKITPKSTAHDLVTNIADNPSKYGTKNAELAQFLSENYEHVLRSTGVDLGTGRSQRGVPNYDPTEHTIYLGAHTVDAEHPLSHTVLEEAAHAATYWQIEHPVGEVQTRAAQNIKSILEQSKKLLPDSDIDKIGDQPYGLPYRHSSLSEFVAGMFSDPSLRRHLESFKVEGASAWSRLVDWVKDLLNLPKGSALDKAMDELVKVGQEQASINPNRKIYDLDPVGAPSLAATGAVLDRTLNEKFTGNYNKWRGYTVPKHVAAGEEVANRLVRYASARVAAPEVAKWMATDVLGPNWKDNNFSRKLGSVLVEDRLRAIRSGFEKLAANEIDPVQKAEFQSKADSVTTSIGMAESSFKTETEYQNALKDAEVQKAITAHKTFLGPMTENMHKYLGGELAEKGEDTGAFVNLIAMLTDGDPANVPTAKDMIYGSTKGNLANPRIRGSAFSKEAKGTGVGYEFDYRKIAERMVRGNYEQYALRRYYEQLVEQGLAVEAKPGTQPPKTLKGQPLEKIEIRPGRAFISGKNLWVRKDLAPEMRRALDVDKVDDIGLKPFTDLATDLQVIGPTDAAWHTINMLAVIAGSQGARSMWYDAVRKLTPVGVVDGVVRMVYNTTKALMDTPDVQKIVAEYSAEGAGRAKPIHRGGLASKLVSAATDIPLEKTQRFDPFHHLNVLTSSLIKAIDKGGRVTAAKMFDNLVARNLVEDSELQRREFINRMGQYNSRLMPQWQSILRDNSLSAFVVAGKNMNRQAIRRIIMSPGFAAKNNEAWVKSRLIESASLASMVIAFPVMMNLAISGKPFGRPGVPIGGIDLGTNDKKTGKPNYFDPLQLLLIRRGLRITGIQAGLQASDEQFGTAATAKQVVNDIFQGYIHPWAGPAVRTAYTAVTGRDISGYLQSKNPNSLAENLWAAVKNSNPSLAALYKDSESGQASPKSVVSSLAGAVGLKQGRAPTHLERLDEFAKGQGFPDYSSMPLRQKRIAEQALDKSKTIRPILSERAGAERQLWEDFARQDSLVSSLPNEQVDWAKQHNLDLHKGFATEVTLGKVRLPSTQQDKDFMMSAVAKEYSKEIGKLMKRETPVSQKQLDLHLNAARARARVALRKKMSGTKAAMNTSPEDVLPQ